MSVLSITPHRAFIYLYRKQLAETQTKTHTKACLFLKLSFWPPSYNQLLRRIYPQLLRTVGQEPVQLGNARVHTELPECPGTDPRFLFIYLLLTSNP